MGVGLLFPTSLSSNALFRHLPSGIIPRKPKPSIYCLSHNSETIKSSSELKAHSMGSMPIHDIPMAILSFARQAILFGLLDNHTITGENTTPIITPTPTPPSPLNNIEYRGTKPFEGATPSDIVSMPIWMRELQTPLIIFSPPIELNDIGMENILGYKVNTIIPNSLLCIPYPS